MAVRIKLPGGTLKLKVYRELRERARRVPVLKMGSLYFTWWSSRQRPLNDQPGAPDDPDRPQAMR
ncbi:MULTISPECIES: hypothetical protein [unclassified Mesorhizobium]|uniref:hypothetical protein n=1 Tax=unclassified Mesorhizobium TaxID=325217 RepID=UPI000FD43672|nr:MULTISPECIES: hypothetical protein [unclassified Mesorhizobium]RUU96677.1 hypothetical protein EOB36_29235 [Mesorhizobium sp. M6A.T.Cr.TU.017.01.1.1]RVB77615.1 hypothetical protein EN885_12840 [Mesorhizobium sp. M6A.T.Cr.TU.014.01.1.1]RWO94935.1 MAG: hypothetical protein EOQ98_28885 [Mesorhizobium sp.]RWP72031.1 MAG: hypothetical protein EOR10_28440 [Mesorhizobium sp.]RWP97640.1 MAG: hypothetical protein EOR90_27755 [Mesorhizobium sp.]